MLQLQKVHEAKSKQGSHVSSPNLLSGFRWRLVYGATL